MGIKLFSVLIFDSLLFVFFSLFIVDIYDRLISIKHKKLLKTIQSIYNNEKMITIYNYDFNSKKSSKSILYNDNNTKFLIIEGIFAHRLNLNYKNSINILCQQNKETCLQRRLFRDELNRGRRRFEIYKRFGKSWYLFYKNLTILTYTNEVYKINHIDKLTYRKLFNKITK